ncbi:MAG: TPM domain-containing protein, partial [Clostridia bacterium]|nr:TPM domain-containing protein [Clostridia bacterium]
MRNVIRGRLWLSALCLLLLLTSCAGAGNKDGAIPSPPETFYVYDGAKVLGDETEEWIVAHDYSLEAQTGAQIVVVCVETTGETDIADYAYRLFNDWGIGSEEKDNGVLLLLSIGEDDYWALQGQGIEDTLSSGMLKLLLNAHLEPHFAAGEYEEGVRETFDALIEFFETAYGVKVDTAAYYAAVENGAWKPAESESENLPASETETAAETGTETGLSLSGVLKTVFFVILIVFAVLVVLAIVAVVIAAFVWKPKTSPIASEIPRRETARKNPYSATFRQGYRGTGSPRFEAFRDIGAASRPSGPSKPFTGYSRIGADRPRPDPLKPSGGPNPFSGFSGRNRTSRPAGQSDPSGNSWPFGIG